LLGEALRNLACVGAEAIAVSDGLNVGSPSDPVEFARLSEVIRGLGDGLRALGLPVTGGNCSLYNESPAGAIPPTPVIGMVGVVDDIAAVPAASWEPGQVVILLGIPPSPPAYSAYGRLVAGAGDPAPAVDLEADLRLAGLLVEQCRLGRITAAKDAATGGLAIALAKLALRSGVGVTIHGEWNAWGLFGEGSGAAWVTTSEEHAAAILDRAVDRGVAAEVIGTVGGERLSIGDAIDLSLTDLAAAHRGLK
jgi:phosphoribosylformylglycinamidine synthase